MPHPNPRYVFAMTAARALAIAASALLVVGTSASAKTIRYQRAVKAGTTAWIDAYSGWNDDCSFLTIQVDVAEKPRHGKVAPRVGTDRIKNIQAGRAAHCLGKPVKVISVYYTPGKGYVGPDSVTIRMKTPKGEPVMFVYAITVR